MKREVPDLTPGDIIESAERVAQGLLRENQGDWLRRHATALLQEVRKYRIAIVGNRRADAERHFHRANHLQTTCLQLHQRNLDEPLLRRGKKSRDEGHQSKRTRNPVILEALEHKLKNDPRATNLQLWQSFAHFGEGEIMQTKKGYFELSMDVVKVHKAPLETSLSFRLVVREGDGWEQAGKPSSIGWNTFVREYAPLARKNRLKNP